MRYLGDKEIESLKWQYLKLSALYREYCDWKRDKATNPALTLPEKFEPATGPMQDINPIVTLYIKYGDVHQESFDYWYKQYNNGACAGEGTSLGRVYDLAGADPSVKYYMRNTFHYVIDFAKRNLGRKPSLLEMADYLSIMMRMHSGSHSYLQISQVDFSKAEVERLIKEVRRILMKKVPSKRFVKDELSRYLRVYTMRSSSPQVTYREIWKKVYHRETDFTENRRRSLIADFNKAKKIIANIETDAQIWW